MKCLKNQRGIALMTSLLLTLIILAITLVALYLLTQGTQTSAANKRYKNVLDSAHGGAEVITKSVINQIFSGYPVATLKGDLTNIALMIPYSSCFKQKLTTATAKWDPAICGGTRGGAKDPWSKDPTNLPDATFTLKGTLLQSNFDVATKIVNTIPGNSDTSGVTQLDSGAGAAYANSGVSPEHIPTLLTIEVQSQRQNKPKEVAKLSVLYAY